MNFPSEIEKNMYSVGLVFLDIDYIQFIDTIEFNYVLTNLLPARCVEVSHLYHLFLHAFLLGFVSLSLMLLGRYIAFAL